VVVGLEIEVDRPPGKQVGLFGVGQGGHIVGERPFWDMRGFNETRFYEKLVW
jgi:hypothetical protein